MNEEPSTVLRILASLTTLSTEAKNILGAAKSITSNCENLTADDANNLSNLTAHLQTLSMTITGFQSQIVVPQNNQWYKLAWLKVKAIPRFGYNRVLKLHSSSILRSNRVITRPDDLSRKEFFTLLLMLTVALFSACGAVLAFYNFSQRSIASQTTTANTADDTAITNTTFSSNCIVDYSSRRDVRCASEKVNLEQFASFFATVLVVLVTTVTSLSLVLGFALYFPWSMLYIMWLVVYLFRETPDTVDEVGLNEGNLMEVANLLPLLSDGAS